MNAQSGKNQIQQPLIPFFLDRNPSIPIPIKQLTNVANSGIDADLFYQDGEFTILLSQPVSFASLTLVDNLEGVVLRALNERGTLVDIDVDASELRVFGGEIIKLQLIGATGTVKDLRFIP